MVSSVADKMRIRTSLVTKVQCSIPRDCLQAERSLLLYCKFAGTLGFMSLAVLLNYRFGDSNQGTGYRQNGVSPARKFSIAMGVIFFCLSLGSLVLGFFNYFSNVSHYVSERTRTGSRVPTNIFLSLVVICLLAVNISFLIDAYS